MAERPEQADTYDALNGNETQESEQEEWSSASGQAGAASQETAFPPLTRIERRYLWL